MKHPLEAAEIKLMEAEFHSVTAQIAQQRTDGLVSLRRLSAKGYIPASYELGNCHYIGNLVKKNQRKAVLKWREAADGGHVYARINLLKYEWYFAGYFRKAVLSMIALSIVARAAWLIFMSDGHDPRLMGNTNLSLKP